MNAAAECARLWDVGWLAHRADTVDDLYILAGFSVSQARRPQAGYQAAPPAHSCRSRGAGDCASHARARPQRRGGDAVRSPRLMCRSKATDRGKEYARHWLGDDSADGGPAARSGSPNVHSVCGESTKYPETGMLHDLL